MNAGTPIPQGGAIMHVDYLAEPGARHLPLDVETLTGPQQHVLALLAEGLSNRQIADRLTITPDTAARYVTDLYAVLGVRWAQEPRAAAVTVGFRKGWLR
jgi:DNA-binding NarL/FixJ family response regulator